MKNSVNCWKLLKTNYHNRIRNDICDGLKNISIYGQSASKHLSHLYDMMKVQRLSLMGVDFKRNRNAEHLLLDDDIVCSL